MHRHFDTHDDAGLPVARGTTSPTSTGSKKPACSAWPLPDELRDALGLTTEEDRNKTVCRTDRRLAS
jgi:hypothetical protein